MIVLFEFFIYLFIFFFFDSIKTDGGDYEDFAWYLFNIFDHVGRTGGSLGKSACVCTCVRVACDIKH